MKESPPEIPDHRLLRIIGRGAYGTVWLAENFFGHRRAVKLVRRDDTADPRGYEREQAGIRQFESLSREHPGLVDVLQVGLLPDTGDFFYVMELADATDPANSAGTDAFVPRTLRRDLERNVLFAPRECLLTVLRIAEALAFLHARGVVHRDVKPSNILLIGGEPKLADGGLIAPSGESLTEVGTRGYTPNEGLGTPGADCFALGRVLHELATGGSRTLHELPSNLLTAGDRAEFLELQEIVFRACDPDPARRYPAADAMERDLRRVIAGESLRRARLSERRAATFRRATIASALAAVVLAAAWGRETRHSHALTRLEHESRTHLLQLHLSNGRRAQIDGHGALAALWFTRALELSRDPAEAAALRWRIGAIRAVTPTVAGIGAHSNTISELTFSPDGRLFASASEDGTVQLLELAEASAGPREPILRATLRHDGPVNSVEFQRSSQTLVTASRDGTVRVWDTRDGAARRTLRFDGEVVRATSSPDGQRIVGAGKDGRLRIWRASTGEPAFPDLRHAGEIQSAEISPDGRWLLTAAHDREARVWSLEDGQLRFPPLRHPADVEHAAWSPDGQTVVTAGADGQAHFWNGTNGQAQATLPSQGHLNYACFSHDGRLVLTASGRTAESSDVQVWDAGTHEPVGPAIRHGDRVRFAVFSPDDLWILTAGLDGLAQLRRVGAGGESIRLQHEGRIWAASFSPDGRRLLTGGRSGLWRLWDLAGAGTSPFRLQGRGTGDAPVVTWLSPDRRRLIAATSDRGATKVWRLDAAGRAESGRELAKKRLVSTFAPDGHRFATWQSSGDFRVCEAEDGGTTQGPFATGAGAGSSAVFGPDGRTLYTLTRFDTLVQGWNLETGARCWPPVALPDGTQQALVLNRDGTRLAVVSGSHESTHGTFALLDAATGQPVAPIQTGREAFRCVQFSPDDRFLAVGSTTPTASATRVLLLDPRTGTPAAPGIPVPDGVKQLEFSPDGRRLAIASIGSRLYLWSVPGFREERSLLIERNATTLHFSPDSRRLAGGLENGATTIWDAATGECLLTLPRHRRSISTVRFEPDGEWLISAGADLDVRLLRLQPVAADTDIRALQGALELDAGMEVARDGSVAVMDTEKLLAHWQARRASVQRSPSARTDRSP